MANHFEKDFKVYIKTPLETRGPWWPWIAHPSHFPHNWILHLCSIGSNLWPSGRGQFWLHRNHMNKIDKCPERDAKYQISKLQSFQFQRRRILKLVFLVPKIQLVTNLWPPGWGQFWANKYHINKLGRGPQGDAKHQISKLYAFQFKEEEFWRWDSLFLCSNLWPTEWCQSWPQEHHLNKLGRGPLEDATYKVWKL